MPVPSIRYQKHPELNNKKKPVTENFTIEKESANVSEDEFHLLKLQENTNHFWDLWKIYEKKVFSYCLYRLSSNYHDAEDLCSETMLRAYLKLPHVSTKTIIYPWLIKVCRNIYFDLLRRKKIFNKIVEELEEEVVIVELSHFFQKEKSIATICYIKKVIDLLPEKASYISRQYFFEERSYCEISRELGCTEAYVRKQIFKVRGYLIPACRRYMNDY
ncbi:RNA polymerase sigma factor [Agarilytica rhodophyticola]|uniref:RNA polymerase sigma factor n=1 Tax=Agarilytica rhodophyticola TaxID=1737490 RepID=UPI000B348725|nr:sigma-70 family RNA polymerase sigma factor [Agarilytica rhodophyticola]